MNQGKKANLSQRMDKDFEPLIPSVKRRVIVDMDAEGNIAKATEYMFNERLQRWESMGNVSKNDFLSAMSDACEDIENAQLNESAHDNGLSGEK